MQTVSERMIIDGTNEQMYADSVYEAAMEDQVDHVRAYFGMRKVSLGRIGGEKNPRPLLNDKFVFHMGMLDQVTSLSVPFFLFFTCTCDSVMTQSA